MAADAQVPAAIARARTVPELLDALQRTDAGRPRLTWYGPESERIELSAKTLANWVAKTANLLVEEFDAGPGTRVHLALPVHWKTVVLDLAVRAVGAEASAGDDPDVLVTADPTAAGQPSADATLVVALAALARRHAGSLAGGIDYAAEVFTHDDVFVQSNPSAFGAPAETYPAGARVLVRTDQPSALGQILDVLRADGSIVLAVPEVTEQMLDGEHLTQRASS